MNKTPFKGHICSKGVSISQFIAEDKQPATWLIFGWEMILTGPIDTLV